MKNRHSHIVRAALLASALIPAAAWAQESQTPPAGPNATAEGPSSSAEETDIIVTGTSVARAAFDTPLSVQALDEGTLARTQAAGNADILNTIPTIKADGGGGEVAANVFVRGLPSGGQYQFTPLMYDGIPVLSTFGLNSSAFDVYYRNDLGIERLEFVRGGVSNLFGPGSVAGLINFISKHGTADFGGVAQIEVAERNRVRGDLAVSGPIGPNTFYSLSGYYRYDEGTLRTNLKTKGYQLRGNLRHEWGDGSGHVTLYGQWIDDQVQFFLPIPLNGTTRKRTPGNDGRKVNSVQNRFDTNLLSFNTPDGLFTSDINQGVKTTGGQIALAFEKQFDGDWGINGRLKYSKYDHKFGLWADGDGVINVPETLQSFLTARSLGNIANASFTFVGGGAVPAGSLLFANRFTDRDRDMDDFTGELNLTKKLTTGSLDHTLTLGAFYGNADAEDVNVTTTYLAEFNNRPRLVNLVTTDPVSGAQTIRSRNGLLNAGAGYVNNRHQVERYAAYFADQMEGERIVFDIGGRIEHFKGDISRERTATVVTDATTPNLSGALRDVVWGNGLFTTGKVDTTEWAAAAGLLFKATPELNFYINGSRGYFFPEVRSVTFNALFQPQSFKAEIIKQLEFGAKYNNGPFELSGAFFYTKLDNRRQVLFVNDGAGGFTERVNLVSTKSYGLEFTANIELVRYLRFAGNLTIQDAEYTAFDTTPAFVGNDLERQPEILYNAGLYYDNDALDASLFTNFTGHNFTAANNAIELKGWNVVNFDAGYKIDLGGDRKVRIGVNVFNLLDEDAVTEGSPRQDINQTVGGAYFVGRPVLPRRITARVTFNF
ncbi:TonB-dependent receptor [Sphingomonas sp.]|uniref:TonB-dependent receptor n=1 Tax=Sphingomonas sp. TaxID=28214 RepID=UPI002DE48401|nr:TonB-dependent receptor [Sphingomonas sp.]